MDVDVDVLARATEHVLREVIVLRQDVDLLATAHGAHQEDASWITETVHTETSESELTTAPSSPDSSDAAAGRHRRRRGRLVGSRRAGELPYRGGRGGGKGMSHGPVYVPSMGWYHGEAGHGRQARVSAYLPRVFGAGTRPLYEWYDEIDVDIDRMVQMHRVEVTNLVQRGGVLRDAWGYPV